MSSRRIFPSWADPPRPAPTVPIPPVHDGSFSFPRPELNAGRNLPLHPSCEILDPNWLDIPELDPPRGLAYNSVSMKTFFKLGLGLVLLTALLIGGVFLFLDKIAQKGIEKIGSQVTQVRLSVGGVSISPLSGNGSISQLDIGNPEGFKSPSAIQVASTRLSVDPGSLFSKKVVIRSILIDAPTIHFEGNLQGSNIMKLQENIHASLGNESGSHTFQVDDILIQNGTIQVNMLGVKTTTLTLPPIHLTDLGRGPEGITAVELTSKIIQAVQGPATETVAHHLGNGVAEEAGKVLKGLGDLFK